MQSPAAGRTAASSLAGSASPAFSSRPHGAASSAARAGELAWRDAVSTAPRSEVAASLWQLPL